MTLTTKQKKEFIAKAHHLKPVVLSGQKGLTSALLQEVDHALNAHELIKVKLNEEKQQHIAFAEKIAAELEAEYLRTVGHIAIFYRKRKEL